MITILVPLGPSECRGAWLILSKLRPTCHPNQIKSHVLHSGSHEAGLVTH